MLGMKLENSAILPVILIFHNKLHAQETISIFPKVLLLQRKYSSMREKYSREKRRIQLHGRNRSAVNETSGWIYMESLAFLEPFVATRLTSSNDNFEIPNYCESIEIDNYDDAEPTTQHHRNDFDDIEDATPEILSTTTPRPAATSATTASSSRSANAVEHNERYDDEIGVIAAPAGIRKRRKNQQTVSAN